MASNPNDSASRILPSYKIVKAVSTAIPDCLEIYDFVAGRCGFTPEGANENSTLSFKIFHQQPENTGLRWVQLKTNTRSTFQRLLETQAKQEPLENLFLSSPYRFGIWKYSQDYSESCCISRNPETGYSPTGSSKMDPQLAIYLPYFKWNPPEHSLTRIPQLLDFAHPSILHTDHPTRSNTIMPIAVQQLWLFVTGSRTVVSFIPQDLVGGDPQLEVNLAEVIESGVPNITAQPQEIDVAADAYVMAAHIVRSACLLQLSGPSVKTPLMQYLEQVVALLSGKRLEAYESFSNSLGNPRLSEPKSRDRHIEFHLHLEAIRVVEELESFQFVLTSQATVIKQILETYGSIQKTRRLIDAQNLLNKTLQDVLVFQSCVDRLLQNASNVQSQILQLLDLKQKEANLSEAEYARFRAEEAAAQTKVTMDQGRTILLFTVITIIFLPLSFFTSYFGMNVSEISGNPQNTSQASFWKISGPLTVAIVFISILVAFNERTRRAIQEIRAQVFK